MVNGSSDGMEATEVRPAEPATWCVAETADFAERGNDRRTVGEKLAALRRFREEKLRDDSYRNEWLERLDEDIAALAGRDPDERLWSLSDALRSDELDERQKFAVRWQHKGHLLLTEWEAALIELIGTHADTEQLERLRRAYPIEVEAVVLWRGHQEFSDSIRALPIGFSL